MNKEVGSIPVLPLKTKGRKKA